MVRPRRAWRGIGALAAVMALGCGRGPATEVAHRETPPPSPSPSPSPSRDDAGFVAAVDALAADALQRGPIAGLSIAVVEHGRTVLAKGYGHADQEAGLAATPET